MTRLSRYAAATSSVAVALLIFTACGGGGGTSTTAGLPATSNNPTSSTMNVGSRSTVDARLLQDDIENVDTTSLLKTLDDEVPIGSTVVGNGEQNPYGLDVAKVSSGKLTAGDLVICDFNNSANVQGTGSTIVALHPVEENKPRLILQNAALLGCNALALGPTDEIWAADFGANNNALVSPNGNLDLNLHNAAFNHPFGEAFASFDGPFGKAAFYESNAGSGTIVRINITKAGFTFDTIAKGFAINNGPPGSILGPSGLQYDAKHDRLYVVDGANNTVTVLRHVSFIPADGVRVNPDGVSFSGPFGVLAHSVFHGAPLNGPISSALLPNGNLAIGNTLDPNGKNLMVEITHTGKLLAVRNVDTGVSGAIFGMVATGTNDINAKIYFNDDNGNFLEVLER